MNKFYLFLILISIFYASHVHAQWVYDHPQTSYDTVQFETAYPYLTIDTSATNVWQIGIPQNTILDSAYSPNMSIMTDTLSTYGMGVDSYFQLDIGYFNHEGFDWNIFLDFKHRWHTDTLKDGGFITVSYDNGLNWINVIDEPDGFFWWDLNPFTEFEGFNTGLNLYTESDTLFNGENGFSGTSTEWVNSGFGWTFLPIGPKSGGGIDTLKIRFNFISDSMDTGKDGWIIDDIRFFSVDIPGSVFENIVPQFNLFPNPASTNLTISPDSYQTNLTVSLYNSQGQLCLIEKGISGDQFQIDCSSVEKGFYFLNLQSDKENLGTRKVLIN